MLNYSSQEYSEAFASFLPLPATEENKMVKQLDDVTKESEIKASEIFDLVEEISQLVLGEFQTVERLMNVVQGNVKLFVTLHAKFPDVKAFQTGLERNSVALKSTKELSNLFDDVNNSLMDVMDGMQFQDIHRQKIERVINVMRSLSNYMNNLLEGRVEDVKRVASADHVYDDNDETLVNNEDIEALIAQFQVKS